MIDLPEIFWLTLTLLAIALPPWLGLRLVTVACGLIGYFCAKRRRPILAAVLCVVLLSAYWLGRWLL